MGAGPLGRVTGAFGRNCIYTRTAKRERRSRLIGDAIDILKRIWVRFQSCGGPDQSFALVGILTLRRAAGLPHLLQFMLVWIMAIHLADDV